MSVVDLHGATPGSLIVANLFYVTFSFCTLWDVSFCPCSPLSQLPTLSSTYLPSPAVDCGDPGQVENAEQNLDGTTYGSFVTYTCSPGYRLTGQGFRTCQVNGFWSGVLPECNGLWTHLVS